MKCRISSILMDCFACQAAASPEEEVCGLLLGRPGEILACRPAANVAARPEQGFEIDPAALLAASREARRDGLSVLGHYHSHPSGCAAPSAEDAGRAGQAGLYWLIVTAREQRLWVSRGGGDGSSAFAPAVLETV